MLSTKKTIQKHAHDMRRKVPGVFPLSLFSAWLAGEVLRMHVPPPLSPLGWVLLQVPLPLSPLGWVLHVPPPLPPLGWVLQVPLPSSSRVAAILKNAEHEYNHLDAIEGGRASWLRVTLGLTL